MKKHIVVNHSECGITNPVGVKIRSIFALGNTTYIDDHSGDKKEVSIYVVLNNGQVCPAVADSQFIIVPFYLNTMDGRVHLSTNAVAGIVPRGSSLRDSINQYNSNIIRLYTDIVNGKRERKERLSKFDKDLTDINKNDNIISYYVEL